MNNRNLAKGGLKAAALLALLAAIPKENLPKSIQNIMNMLDYFNPVKRMWDMLTELSSEEAMEQLQKGDHIYVYRVMYSHHGIYAGDGQVWEYEGTGPDARVCLSTLEDFAEGQKINKMNYVADFSPEEIITRATSRVFEQEYNVWDNNCMHYAFWCRLAGKEKITATENAYLALLGAGKNGEAEPAT